MNSDTPVLALEGVSKSFGPVQALEDVDFSVQAGEVVALVGDNGAGKSTLVKVIAGIHQADSGEIRFEGDPVQITAPNDAYQLGIATVYQDLALCDNLDVVENLFLGREETAGLLELIRRLRENGHGVGVISPNLADVFAVADRVFVLRLGRKAGDFPVGETSQEDVVAAITGAEFGGDGRGGDE